MGLLGLIGTRGGISWSPTALDAYLIEKSIRFNGGDSSYLSKSFDDTPSGLKHTWSFWFKQATGQTGNENLFGSWIGGSYQTDCWITSLGKFGFYQESESGGACIYYGNRQYRDPSAWYHAVISIDRTQATNTDRMKIYINGEDVTSDGHSGSPAYPNQNVESYFPGTATNDVSIGRFHSGQTLHYNGLIADFQFIDGEAKTASDFGEFDLITGVWYPKGYTGGSYGTNGYYLKFNGTDLGEDSSGNGNDWTANNLEGPSGTVDYTTMISGNPYLPANAFTSSYINSYINTSTFAVTNAQWMGPYEGTTATSHVFTPSGGLPVTSSLIVYFGAYNNNVITTTLLVTYTDSSTETDTFTSSTNVHMKAFTASNAAGKTIQSIQVSGAVYSILQFGGFVVDGAILETINPDTGVLTDTPTNYGIDTGVGGEVSGNYGTLNPLECSQYITLSGGNLAADAPGANWGSVLGNFGMSAGLWYWEVDRHAAEDLGVAIAKQGCDLDYSGGQITSTTQDAWGIISSGNKQHDGTSTSYGNSYSTDDIVGVSFDADNGNLYFYVNGVIQASGTPAFTGLTDGPYFPAVSNFGHASGADRTLYVNFGQRPFDYAAPSGYKCLCTQNLADPTIVNPSKVFEAKTYTGSSSTKVVEGLNFSPDLLWLKDRDATNNHQIHDAVRGESDGAIYPNDTTAVNINDVLQFDTNGFTLDTTNTGINSNNNEYISWAWNAGTANTVDSAYNGDQTWSGLWTGTAGYGSFANLHDAYTTNYVQTLNGTFTLGSALPVTSLRVYLIKHGTGCTLSINGTDVTDQLTAGTSLAWSTITGFTSLSSIEVTGTDYTNQLFSLQGIEVNGKLLVDTANAFSAPVGGLNSSVYDQSDTWSDNYTCTSGSFGGSTPATFAFNGVINSWSNAAEITTPSVATFTQTNLTPNAAVVVYTSEYNGGGGGNNSSDDCYVEINGTKYVGASGSGGGQQLERTGTVDSSGNLTITNTSITGNASPGWNYVSIQGISVGGQMLIDPGVSVTNVPLINTIYRANPSAGFSCVSYTGSGTSGDTVAHGLNDKPQLILTKNRDNNDYWAVYHTSLTSGSALQLDDPVGEFGGSQLYTSTPSTSSVFTVGSNHSVNASSEKYISYCWSEVAGYSRYSSYIGNGSADGPFVWCGFKPALVIIKHKTQSQSWIMYDTARSPYNLIEKLLNADNSNAEAAWADIDILSNGFKVRDTHASINTSAHEYIFMAWAESTFKHSRAQ